jgi:hypothetical protein
MPEVNPKTYHISASSIAAFKSCPTRFRLAYREGLRLDKDTDSQRRGTNWHKMHEIYAQALPQGEDFADQAVIELLNSAYCDVPTWKTADEWNLERTILHVSFIGYKWFWQNDPIQVLASEVPFNLPLHMPRTGLPLPMEDVQRVGKIDHIIKWQSSVCALERKSTTRSIAHDSDYWEKGQKDSQVSMYALAFQDLIAAGQMPCGPLPLKEGESMPRVGNTLYDVFHVPTIKPAMLTQTETKEFLTTGTYCGQQFNVYQVADTYNINGSLAVVEQGKKAIAIRETIEMYAARLLQDIYTRPDFYYARREIARTDAEIRNFRQQLFGIYQSQKSMAANNAWFENESQCRATFPCPYIPICYGCGADSVCDGRTTPNGFKRIFVDLTINGTSVVEED